MLKCWACGYILKGRPDRMPDPSGYDEDLADDLVVTCPKCLTRHVYTEDRYSRPRIAQAEKAGGGMLYKPHDRRPSP